VLEDISPYTKVFQQALNCVHTTAHIVRCFVASAVVGIGFATIVEWKMQPAIAPHKTMGFGTMKLAQLISKKRYQYSIYL
jgi:hypothetical protein